jgi:putative tricarboxylic transport membrane protein
VEEILPAAWEGLTLVFSWPNILYPVAGTLLAMLVAFLPGISGATLMALAIPFTLSWEPLPVALTFGGLVGGATFMGSVTAILFNVPGTGPSAATMIDGHPLARQGLARTALGCAALSSALGSTFGILALILLIPVMRPAVMAFGPPELMMLAVWGLSTIAAISFGSTKRALGVAGLGLLFAFVGHDPRTAEQRFTFGSEYLWDGLAIVPVMLGLFSIAEVMDLSVSGRKTISGTTNAIELGGSVRDGAIAVVRNFGLLVRSSIIGTVIGIIPGVGGTVASFVAYGQAVQTSRDKERFGKGDIRGVIAPEAAHDAKDGGALLPVFAFGVPGSEGAAVLMAVLLLHGMAPGRDLMTTGLPLVFVMIWSLFLSNWLTSLVGLALVGPLARLTVLRVQALAPVIFVIASLGAYLYKGRVSDVAAAFIFGIAGYYMKKYGWPRIPLVIALLLGGAFELHLHVTWRLWELGRLDPWTRPIFLALIALTILSFWLPRLQGRMRVAGS